MRINLSQKELEIIVHHMGCDITKDVPWDELTHTEQEAKDVFKRMKDLASVMEMHVKFEGELRDIIAQYKGNDDYLEEDDVNKLTEYLRNRIRLLEGIIEPEEYLELEKAI